MAPVLTEPDKDPESPRTTASPPRPARPPRRFGRTLHALLKSNLKNLLADCGAQLQVRAANGLHDFSSPDAGAMKNVLGENCKPINGIMDSEKLEKEDVMGLHSANSSNLQDLLNNKKQLAGSLVVSSPPPDLVDMIQEFETVAEAAPLTSGNGDVPADEMQMITQLVTSMDEAPPAAPAAEPAAAAAVAAEAGAAAVTAAAAPAAVPITVEATRARQTQLAGRSARLLRRLHVLQTRTARRQTSSQASALLDQLSAARTAPAAATGTSTPAATAAIAAAATPGDITEMLRSPNAKHFSTTQLVNLVLNNKTATAAAAATVPTVPPPPQPSECTASSARVEREVAAAAVRPSGVARRQVERLLAAEDSDATESSSGGESGDEFDAGWDDETQERAAPIRKRALWRWATERSAVASRWSWLTAQVTDLEFRVRQLRQLHRQLRAAQPRPAVGRSSRYTAGRQAGLRELGGAGDAPCSAAVRDLTKASESAAVAADGDQGDGQCARSRRWPAGPRRRVFSVTRGCRRPVGGVPARCRCEPGLDSCTTCAGRLDSGASLRPETQPARERRALLEPGYHPVLSLPTEAALSLGYDALLRSSRWQRNHLHARPRGPRVVTKETGGHPAPPASPAMTSAAVSSSPAAVTPCSRPSFHRRKSGVLKRFCELDGGGSELALGGSNGRLGRPPKLSRRSRSASASVCDARPAAGAGPPPLAAPAPAPAADDDPAWPPGRHSPERRESRERPAAPPQPRRAPRHRQNSYDIDNIVIPASMASTAKIEKPKYKEIVTPGWRVVDLRPAALNGEPAAAAAAAAELEPLADAAFERRHQPAELAERCRLYQATGQPAGGSSGPAAAAAGAGHGRGRRAHTPDTPRAADPGAAERPRILRYHYSLEPCGFASRHFPLTDGAWKELLAAADAGTGTSSPHQWRSPHSLAGSSTESAPETEEQRAAK